MTELILPAIQNIAGSFKYITLLTLYEVLSRLVILLTFIYASVQVFNIPILTTVSSSLITAFKYSLFFVFLKCLLVLQFTFFGLSALI
jgi:hypothetical protein